MEQLVKFRIFLFFVFVTLCLLPLRLAAEDSAVFAPFASRLKLSVKDNTVKITWSDSSDITGGYRVYRSQKKIDETGFAEAAQIGIVNSGVGYFIDTVPVTGEYYYAVLAEESDTLYRVFLPFRNTSSAPLAVRALSVEEMAVNISDIHAETKDDSVIITFTPSRSDREIYIFRSSAPLLSAEDFSSATHITTLESAFRAYVDYPVPGIDYFYAAVDRALFEKGNPVLTEGGNSTKTAVSLPLGSIRTGLPAVSLSERTAPLPTLRILTSLETGERYKSADDSVLPRRVALNPATSKALAGMLSDLGLEEEKPLQAEILSADLAVDTAGEDYTLKQVLTASFGSRRWAESITLLSNFLSVPRSDEITGRTHFYLGQCLFFTGEYRKAVLEFLAADSVDYEAVTPWIERALLLIDD